MTTLGDLSAQQKRALLARVMGGGTKVPVTFAQERLWFLEQLSPGEATYHMPYAMRLRGSLQPEALAQAWQWVVARHAALRTVFTSEDGVPVAHVRPEIAVPLLISAHASIEAALRAPFDLVNGPLARALLIEHGPNDHTFVMVLHHLAGDAVSFTVLCRELSRAYRDFAVDQVPAAEPLRVQYPDFARWQRTELPGAELDRQLAYWKSHLAGAPPLLELPTDFPRPPIQSPAGEWLQRNLSPEIVTGVKELAASHGVTPFMVLFAVYQVVLARYTGSDDIVVGAPVSGRPFPETEELIGLFVNTVALRTSLAGNPPFQELLQRVRQSTLDGLSHQELPFESLVEALAPERTLAHAPICQVQIIFQAGAAATLDLPGITAELVPASTHTSKVDLTLYAELRSDLALVLEYRTDLFTQEWAVRFLDCFAMALNGAITAPQTRVADLPILTPARLAEVGASAPPVALAPPVAHDEKAGIIGAMLKRAGAGLETPVGICMSRSAEMLSALLGVWQAGGQYVPLDPHFPVARLRMMVEDCGLALVLSDNARHATAAQIAPDALLINVEALPSVEPLDAPMPWHDDGAAYTIFTSGSTGRPKGVTISRSSVANLISSFAQQLDLGPGDTFVAITTLSFDIALLELLLPVQTGARLVIATSEQAADPDLLRQLLFDVGATAMQATPATWRMLTETGGVPDSLRLRLCGGEALPPDLAFSLTGNGIQLWNVYGPTETTIWSAATLVEPGAPVEIGPPVADTQLYILDSRLLPVPLGVTGQLYIGGAGVARGYHGRPGLTASKFLPDPFRPGRIYATGDLARWRDGGKLELLGRSDHQVKIRGFRVELGEIESVLLGHPGVRQGAVSVVDGHLIGYVVPGPPEGLDGYLRERLPGYMVPAVFVSLAELPLTPNGKVSRASLPSPAEVRPNATVAPRNELERKLAGIWSELLPPGVAIGVNDGFFALGGHSMAAVRLVSRVRESFGVALPVQEIFARQTIGELAALIAADPSLGTVARPALKKLDVLDDLSDDEVEELLRATLSRRRKRQAPARYPAGIAQVQMWLADRLAPGQATYHLAMIVKMRGELDVDALKSAVNRLAGRHEILRVAFETEGGEPVQVCLPALEIPLPMVTAADDEQASGWQEELIARPFTLTERPLWRMLLIQRGPGEHDLVLVAHHAVADAESLDIVLRDLRELYRAEVLETVPQLPSLPAGYTEYARWQRDPVRETERQDHLAYWAGLLSDAPQVLELPTDYPRPAVRTSNGSQQGVPIEPSTSAQVLAFCRQEGVTPFQVLLTAYAAVLARYAQQETVIVGSPVSGRIGGDYPDAAGPFVNIAALRVDLPSHASFREVLDLVRTRSAGALEHAEVSVDELVAVLRPERSASVSPLFQVMFVYHQPASGTRGSWPGLSVTVHDPPMKVARYDLTLVMWQLPDGSLAGRLDYNTSLFDPGTMDRLAVHLGQMLTALVAAPGERVWDVPLAQHRPAATNPSYTSGPLLPELITAQAARTPSAPALITVEAARTPSAPAPITAHALSYADVIRRARETAGWLRAQGAGPDTTVGLAMRSGPDALIALTGILLAGASYVPVDPSDPRHLAILADAGVILTLSALPETEAVHGDGPRPVHEESAAYVIYTSGSTGEPKGVVVSHAAVRNLALAFRERHRFGPGDRILMIPPLTFDASAGDVFPALISGAALVVHPSPATLTGPGLLAFCAEYQVTTVDAPSSLWQQWAQDLAEVPAEVPECLIRMMVGGEAVPMARLRDWAKATHGQVELYNHYGPTEATVCATTFSTVTEVAGAELPIGVPLPNVDAYVLDRHGQLTPAGVPGELHLGGAGVARGYQGQPALTAQRFVPDPFAARPGARMYRTGDLARCDADGQLVFLGRADHQVKIRGYRIELAEIEAALSASPGVRQAAVLAPLNAHGQRVLAAYVSGDLTVATLREDLIKRLPGYLIPSSFTILDELPLTAHGKVDRDLLPEPAATERAAFIAPRTPSEHAVARAWSEALNTSPIGVNDNFLDLGGHSLLAAKILARLSDETGVTLPLPSLMEAPNLSEVARQLEHGPGARLEIDLRAEGQLPSDLHITEFSARPWKRILLTGPTGFLGAYLLKELITRTEAQVLCLVRAGSESEGRQRVEANLHSYGLWDNGCHRRIAILPGDLGAPGLGLLTPSQDVDAIFHNGGAVDFVKDYAGLSPINVGGTLELLRLASQGASLHFVSTLGIYLGGASQTVTEAVAPDDPAGLRSGYNQSKWVADALVRAARDAGLPITVHRPARVTGDSRTGITNTGDYFCALLKAFTETGAVPDLPEHADMAPVDFVARAIVTLALSGLDGHYRNNRTLAFGEIAAEMGLALLPYSQWRDTLMRGVREGTVTSFAPHAAALPKEFTVDTAQIFFDCSATEKAAGEPFPPADRALLRRYLNFLTETGFLKESR